jgi:hypothetical protein
MNSEDFRQDVKKMLSYDGASLMNKINRQLYPRHHKKNLFSIFRSRPLWYAAAAVLLVVIVSAIYFLSRSKTDQSPGEFVKSEPAKQLDVAPGIETATLTLDNGSSIILNHVSNGKIAEQGGTIITKEDGRLAYNATSGTATPTILFNTLTIPRAGYYSSLVLADGSKVWLNSESSIRFPTAFPDKERIVEVTGEVYFEVAKNPSQPFRVNIKDKGTMIEVLGTHFNVSAYDDGESIATTLLEGSVKVTTKQKTVLLKPGQQALVRQDGGQQKLKVYSGSDLENVMAWKNGMFRFRNADLKTIMREVSRWYDVEVIYESDIPTTYTLMLSRNIPVSKLFEVLQETGGAHFKVGHKTVWISK